MKLKKTLLAGATAATVAFAGVGVASAQEGSTDLPTSSISQSSEEGSGEGSSDLSGSLDDAFGEDGIFGSFAPDGGGFLEGIPNIGNIAGAVAAIVGMIGAILAFI